VIADVAAIDGFNLEANRRLAVVDASLRQYLRTLEGEAKARLLKYQYLVAKAYEYRMVRPYPGNLNVRSFFDKAIKVAESATDGLLLEAQFDELVVFYESVISKVASEIWDALNQNPPELSTVVSLGLSSEDLKVLNETGRLKINLFERGLLSSKEDNHRIVSMAVEFVDVDSTIFEREPTAILRFGFEHSGKSIVRSAGRSYLFRHVGGRMWGTVVDIRNSRDPLPEPESAAEGNLIDSLLERASTPRGKVHDAVAHFRPAAWSDITLVKETLPEDLFNIPIRAARLRIQLDLRRPITPEAVLVVSGTGGLDPLVLVEPPDLAGRQMGQVPFARFYPAGTKARLTAPPQIAERRFKEWRVGGEGPDQTTALLSMLRHCAGYPRCMMWARHSRNQEHAIAGPRTRVPAFGDEPL
jgi:hypothetical protein